MPLPLGEAGRGFQFPMYDLQQLNSLPVEDVARRLGLQVARHTCRCFMHDDHHPSLFFSVAKNRWRCFVCDVGGGPIDLVMHRRQLPFRDACRWLSDSYGIYVPAQSRPSVRTANIPECPAKPQTAECCLIPDSGTLPDVQLSIVHSQLSIAKGQNSFTTALVATGMLTQEQMTHAVARYRLGSYEDAVVFLQIDADGGVREGKVMYYMPDGHRSHERKPLSLSWLMKNKMKDGEGRALLRKEWTASHCLFGLHLLSEQPRTVAVVESEKTAVVCSELLPEAVWMASGGLSALNAEQLKPLQGRRIILFPDTDLDGTTFRRWSAIAEEASTAMHQPIMVSNLLECHASHEQKQQKIDILDFVVG